MPLAQAAKPRTVLVRTAVTMAATALVPAFVTPAHASGTTATTVPSCVTTYLDDRGAKDHLWVTNTCRYIVRAKVVLAQAHDLPCHTYDRGETRYWNWHWPGRFDGLRSC